MVMSTETTRNTNGRSKSPTNGITSKPAANNEQLTPETSDDESRKCYPDALFSFAIMLNATYFSFFCTFRIEEKFGKEKWKKWIWRWVESEISLIYLWNLVWNWFNIVDGHRWSNFCRSRWQKSWTLSIFIAKKVHFTRLFRPSSYPNGVDIIRIRMSQCHRMSGQEIPMNFIENLASCRIWFDNFFSISILFTFLCACKSSIYFLLPIFVILYTQRLSCRETFTYKFFFLSLSFLFHHV